MICVFLDCPLETVHPHFFSEKPVLQKFSEKSIAGASDRSGLVETVENEVLLAATCPDPSPELNSDSGVVTDSGKVTGIS